MGNLRKPTSYGGTQALDKALNDVRAGCHSTEPSGFRHVGICRLSGMAPKKGLWDGSNMVKPPNIAMLIEVGWTGSGQQCPT